MSPILLGRIVAVVVGLAHGTSAILLTWIDVAITLLLLLLRLLLLLWLGLLLTLVCHLRLHSCHIVLCGRLLSLLGFGGLLGYLFLHLAAVHVLGGSDTAIHALRLVSLVVSRGKV